MKARGFWHLGALSDERLVASLRELLAVEGRNEARIVAHLAEVDARRIHLKGAPSLFEYCQKRLGLSDCQAYYRIAAARVAQKFPVVFELLERRRIHIPREVMRQVVARDGLCCSYVGDDGVRCTARAFLQIDHQRPWARAVRTRSTTCGCSAGLTTSCSPKKTLASNTCSAPSLSGDYAERLELSGYARLPRSAR